MNVEWRRTHSHRPAISGAVWIWRYLHNPAGPDVQRAEMAYFSIDTGRFSNLENGETTTALYWAPFEYPEGPVVEPPIDSRCAEITMRLADAMGRRDCVELLAQFGALKVRDLKPEQYGAFIEAAQTALCK